MYMCVYDLKRFKAMCCGTYSFLYTNVIHLNIFSGHRLYMYYSGHLCVDDVWNLFVLNTFTDNTVIHHEKVHSWTNTHPYVDMAGFKYGGPGISPPQNCRVRL